MKIYNPRGNIINMDKKPKDRVHCGSMPLLAKLIIVFVVVLLVKMVVLVLLWAWIVPDLFPGAVAQGLIVATVPWLTAFKIGLVAAIVAVLCKLKMHHCCKKYGRKR